MSMKRKSISSEVKVNISPAKIRKEKSETNVGCILQSTEKNPELRLTNCFPVLEYGYHRKCYQIYARGKLTAFQQARGDMGYEPQQEYHYWDNTPFPTISKYFQMVTWCIKLYFIIWLLCL